MIDPLRIEPHPEQQRTYAELREDYRSNNLKRIREQLADYRINGVRMKLLGTPIAATTEIYDHDDKCFISAGTPKGRAMFLLAAMDAPVTQDFGLDDIPLDLRRELSEIASECDLFEKVTWADGTEGVVDHDGPACSSVEEMAEQEQLDYVDRAIEESKRG